MSKEIKKETDWLGREKDVIYEGGKKVGETRHETTIFGTPKDVTYNTKGNKVSETRHETTLFGTSKEVTRDTDGNKVSETRYEEGIFGGKKGVIYENGRKIGELKTEKGIFSGRKQVLHESGEDVDLTRRTIKKDTKRSESYREHDDRSYTTRDKDSNGSSASQLETTPIKNKTPWSSIREINENEALTWLSDRIKEELKEQNRKLEGFDKWFNSSESNSAKGGKWGYYNQEERRKKIWGGIQFLESLLNSPEEVRRMFGGPTYHSSGGSMSQSGMAGWQKGLIGLLIGSAVIIGKIGIKERYDENKKPQEKPGAEVARRYNLSEKGLVEKSSGFPWTRLPESSEHYREDMALYRLKNNKKEITPKLEESLIGLRKLMESKKKEIRFNDFTQFEDNIWVAGESCSDSAYFGYIWHSPDCGNTWFWQWRIGPWLQKYNFGGTPDVPFGVYFFDSKEGWSFTQNSIFHTTDGGRKWNQSYKHNIGKLKQFYIIDKQNLVAMREMPTVIGNIHDYTHVMGQTEYTINGGKTWKSHPKWKPEILGLEAKLTEDSTIKLESPYK